VRWLGFELAPPQAGTLVWARIALENAGAARWRTTGGIEGIKLSYHWLDERGNPIVWDGLRISAPLAPGERAELELPIRAPMPPGPYRLSVDLVDENRFWFTELGNVPLEREVDVRPRRVDDAVAHLPDGAEPAPGWEERVRALHEEGYAAVGGAIEAAGGRFGRREKELEPWAPGGGRDPAFSRPLLLPSLLPPLTLNDELFGLPAWHPELDEPWIYDGRLVVTVPPPAGRRRG
jgi:hypothetical protein